MNKKFISSFLIIVFFISMVQGVTFATPQDMNENCSNQLTGIDNH